MSKYISEISNLLELIENGTISIVSVESKMKVCSDIAETENLTTEMFVESLQYLNEARLFRNGVDFCYEFTGRNGMHMDCTMKNPFLDEYFFVECAIKDGISADEVDRKLRGMDFKGADEKIAV